MTIPHKITYDLGADRFGRKLELIDDNGRFTLHREAADQRDNRVLMELTPAQLAALVEVARS